MTIFMDFLMFIVAVFLMTIVMSVDKINAWQEKKRIKKLPIKKMKLRCICKTTCYMTL